jgi:hypothetical protein
VELYSVWPVDQVGVAWKQVGVAYGTGGHGLLNRQARLMEQVGTAY